MKAIAAGLVGVIIGAAVMLAVRQETPERPQAQTEAALVASMEALRASLERIDGRLDRLESRPITIAAAPVVETKTPEVRNETPPTLTEAAREHWPAQIREGMRTDPRYLEKIAALVNRGELDPASISEAMTAPR